MAAITDPQTMSLVISQDQWEMLCKEASNLVPEEACGLLAGIGGRVTQVIPVQNSLHSPVRYRMDPVEQLQAFQYIDKMGWELVGIYHSHPSGPGKPSETDLAEAYYPEAIYAILYPSGRDWAIGAFYINKDSFHLTPVTLLSQSNEK